MAAARGLQLCRLFFCLPWKNIWLHDWRPIIAREETESKVLICWCRCVVKFCLHERVILSGKTYSVTLILHKLTARQPSRNNPSAWLSNACAIRRRKERKKEFAASERAISSNQQTPTIDHGRSGRQIVSADRSKLRDPLNSRAKR